MEVIWRDNQTLRNGEHIGVWGQTGSGKSTFCEFLAQGILYQHLKEKIIDLFDEGRLENGFYAFPQDNPHFIDLLKAFGYAPRNFPIEVYLPLTSDIDEDVPVFFKPFRIPFPELTVDDLSMLIGGEMSALAGHILYFFMQRREEIGSLDELISQLTRFSRGGRIKFTGGGIVEGDARIVNALLRQLMELNASGIVCGKDDPDALDMDKILRDRETITSFTVKFVEQTKFKYLVWQYLLRKIVDLRLRERKYPRCTVYIREIANLAPSNLGLMPFAYETRNSIARMGREGRDLGIRILCDSQRPHDVLKTVRSQLYYNYTFRLQYTDVDAVNEVIAIPMPIRQKIPNLQTGVCCMVSPKGFHYPLYVLPSLALHKEGRIDFFDLCNEKGIPFKRISGEKTEREFTIEFPRLKENGTEENAAEEPKQQYRPEAPQLQAILQHILSSPETVFEVSSFDTIGMSRDTAAYNLGKLYRKGYCIREKGETSARKVYRFDDKERLKGLLKV